MARTAPVLAVLVTLPLLAGCAGTRVRASSAAAPNRLSDAEAAAGWVLLFDGKTTAGWRGYRQDSMPAGWQVVDGALARVGEAGDIVTEGEWEDFELQLEWKIGPGGNSGVFFHATEATDAVYENAPELQVLDDAGHANGLDPRTAAGANYALHAPARAVARPVGEWNHVRIRVENGVVTHWMNGVELLSYRLWSSDWRDRVADSKFAQWPSYGMAPKGRIALQDHGDPVWYRSIKLLPL